MQGQRDLISFALVAFTVAIVLAAAGYQYLERARFIKRKRAVLGLLPTHNPGQRGAFLSSISKRLMPLRLFSAKDEFAHDIEVRKFLHKLVGQGEAHYEDSSEPGLAKQWYRGRRPKIG